MTAAKKTTKSSAKKTGAAKKKLPYRTIKSPPKKGKIPIAVLKKAVKIVSDARKKEMK